MEKQRIYDGLNEAYFSENCHEKAVIDHLPELLSDAKLFVDLGASLGQYSFNANKCMNAGEIIAVEPDPIRHEELQRNGRKWEAESDNKITAIHAAVAEKNGSITFYSTNSNISGGLFTREVNNATEAVSPDWEPQEVQCLTLDGLCGDRLPDVVKIDVEGVELRVLKGAENILRAGNTKFLIELHSWVDTDPSGQNNPEEVVEFLRTFGYKVSEFYGKKLFSKTKLVSKRKGFFQKLFARG